LTFKTGIPGGPAENLTKINPDIALLFLHTFVAFKGKKPKIDEPLMCYSPTANLGKSIAATSKIVILTTTNNQK